MKICFIIFRILIATSIIYQNTCLAATSLIAQIKKTPSTPLSVFEQHIKEAPHLFKSYETSHQNYTTEKMMTQARIWFLHESYGQSISICNTLRESDMLNHPKNIQTCLSYLAYYFLERGEIGYFVKIGSILLKEVNPSTETINTFEQLILRSSQNAVLLKHKNLREWIEAILNTPIQPAVLSSVWVASLLKIIYSPINSSYQRQRYLNLLGLKIKLSDKKTYAKYQTLLEYEEHLASDSLDKSLQSLSKIDPTFQEITPQAEIYWLHKKSMVSPKKRLQIAYSPFGSQMIEKNLLQSLSQGKWIHAKSSLKNLLSKDLTPATKLKWSTLAPLIKTLANSSSQSTSTKDLDYTIKSIQENIIQMDSMLNSYRSFLPINFIKQYQHASKASFIPKSPVMDKLEWIQSKIIFYLFNTLKQTQNIHQTEVLLCKSHQKGFTHQINHPIDDFLLKTAFDLKNASLQSLHQGIENLSPLLHPSIVVDLNFRIDHIDDWIQKENMYLTWKRQQHVPTGWKNYCNKLELQNAQLLDVQSFAYQQLISLLGSSAQTPKQIDNISLQILDKISFLNEKFHRHFKESEVLSQKSIYQRLDYLSQIRYHQGLAKMVSNTAKYLSHEVNVVSPLQRQRSDTFAFKNKQIETIQKSLFTSNHQLIDSIHKKHHQLRLSMIEYSLKSNEQLKKSLLMLKNFRKISQQILPYVLVQQIKFLKNYSAQISKWKVDLQWQKVSYLSPESLELLERKTIPSVVLFNPFRELTWQ